MKKTKLTPEEIEILLKECGSAKFFHDFDFVYEKQIPNTGVALVRGEIQILKRKRILERVLPGTLLGVYHLIHDRPVEGTCKVIRDSEVILVKKSDIIEAIENSDSNLHWLLERI